MLRIDAMVTINKDSVEYSHNFQPGMKVKIDAIKPSESASGFSVRVVGIWKKPLWFDTKWFKELS